MNPLDAIIIRIARLEEELAHIRANHAEMVKRNALLRDWLDLPLERTKEYEAFIDELTRMRDLESTRRQDEDRK